jgi:hypothetical protein
MTPKFWSLTREQRRIHLDRSLKARDITRPARQEGIWLVSSASLTEKYGYPIYYRVNVREASCHCYGYQTNRVCRHVARGIYEAWQAHQAPTQSIAA